MERREGSSFWPSYVDVMTTLFAVMLVLFAVSYSRFKVKEVQLRSLVDEYENIITVYSTVGKIDSTRYFGYNAEYLKHLFTVDVEYQQREYRTDRLALDLTSPAAASLKRDSILSAGRLVKQTIERIESHGRKRANIKFLVVVEGQASRVAFDQGDWQNNSTLSYLRARWLVEFWKAHGIDLAAIPRCELIVSGSGEGGVPRIVPDERQLRASYPRDEDYAREWLREEGRNQRFLIHIVPVIGNIDVTRSKIERLKED